MSRSARNLTGEYRRFQSDKADDCLCCVIFVSSSGPTLVILEPQMTSVTEIAISTSGIPPSARGVDGKNQKHLKLMRGLGWILAPGYAEDKNRRTVVEISKVDDKDVAMGTSFGFTSLIRERCSCRRYFLEDEPRPAAEHPSNVERFIVSSDGDVIATFERRKEVEAPGQPWLDRVGSSYQWILIEEALEREK